MDENAYFAPNRQTSSWIIDKQTCRIQTSNPKVTEQVGSWSFATLVGRCIIGPTRIFSIPRPKWRWALKRLGIDLPLKKSNRVIAGLKTSRQNFKRGAEGPGQENLKGIGEKIFPKTKKEVKIQYGRQTNPILVPLTPNKKPRLHRTIESGFHAPRTVRKYETGCHV